MVRDFFKYDDPEAEARDRKAENFLIMQRKKKMMRNASLQV